MAAEAPGKRVPGIPQPSKLTGREREIAFLAATGLSAEQVASVGARFKVTLRSPGPLYSASLIHERRVEAEEANRRARELEREAQQRAAELEEARERAGEAAAEAQTADRAREKAEAAAFVDRRQPPAAR